MKKKLKSFYFSGNKIKKNKDLSKDILKILRETVDTQQNLEDFDIDFKDAVLDDYLELVIQFGFVSLFSIAFPLTPLISLITNRFEIEVDKYKILNLYKRPIPYRAKNIGSWIITIEFIGYLSIFTNLGLLCFCSNTFYELTNEYRFLIFALLSAFYFFFKFSLDKFLPDVPNKIRDLNTRLKNVSEKLLKICLKKQNKFDTDKKVDFNIYVSN